jgi:hypothetical protein
VVYAVAHTIVCENSKPGSPSCQWNIDDRDDPNIKKFVADISVIQGETVDFKISSRGDDCRTDF